MPRIQAARAPGPTSNTVINRRLSGGDARAPLILGRAPDRATGLGLYPAGVSPGSPLGAVTVVWYAEGACRSTKFLFRFRRSCYSAKVCARLSGQPFAADCPERVSALETRLVLRARRCSRELRRASALSPLTPPRTAPKTEAFQNGEARVPLRSGQGRHWAHTTAARPTDHA